MSFKVVVLAAKFNEIVTKNLVDGALRALGVGVWPGEAIQGQSQTGCSSAPAAPRGNVSVHVHWVPGSFELPLAAARAFEAGADAVVALGAVIKGGTDHYQFVCQAVTQGLAATQRDFRRPVGFGVLTCDNLEQALDRAGGKQGNKGADAAAAVLEMLELRVSL